MINCARVLMLTAVLVSWQVSPALAGSLRQSAARLAAEAGRQLPGPAAGEPRRSVTAEQGSLAESPMSKRKKFLIVAAAVIGVAAGMYAIDHGVVDNTPSSKGTRKD